MVNFVKQFKKRYCHYGKIGHKTEDYWILETNIARYLPYWHKTNNNNNVNNNNNSQNVIICHYCGKKGHKANVCYKKI